MKGRGERLGKCRHARKTIRRLLCHRACNGSEERRRRIMNCERYRFFVRDLDCQSSKKFGLEGHHA
jgi:hypothetical protein